MPAISESRYMVQATWNDVPHLDEDTKRQLMAAILPHQREARSMGVPSMGAGAIYPIILEEVEVKPFQIPPYWPRAFGFDVGWNKTAAIWLAKDPLDGVIYAYAEHYRGQAEPEIHAAAVKARGLWIRGAIDPASRGRGQKDGEQLMLAYQNLGLNLVPAINAVEAGIYEVWSRLSTGRLKFFSSCQNLKAEYRLYRRDEKGRIVKEYDHALDALRYGVATFDKIAMAVPPKPVMVSGGRIADSKAGY
jgi:hypothetical protein